MPVIAMTIVDAKKHPDAEALRVYDLDAPGTSPCQIVANLENIYDVGDIVAIARCGSILLDGTQINKTRLRGIVSMGMALGKSDANPGEDLSVHFCKPELNHEAKHIAWTSIGGLSCVRKELEGRALYRDDFSWPVVTCRAKVKLHGTNGGIQILPNGAVIPQSRNLILEKSSKSIAGFYRWVLERSTFFSSLAGEETIIIFGEFCGESIQKGTALNKIKQKIFAIFAVQIGDGHTQQSKIEVDPDRISALIGERPEGVHILPWHGDEFAFDYTNRSTLERAVAVINNMVQDVEACDPWVKNTFGVEGIGEGVVMYPVAREGHYDVKTSAVLRDEITHLMFKAKGQKHAVRKTKAAVQIDPEIAKSIDEFVQMFVTQARCEQALGEINESIISRKHTGPFLKWIALDIQKESKHELTASDLTWKQVSHPMSSAARCWFFAYVESIQG